MRCRRLLRLIAAALALLHAGGSAFAQQAASEHDLKAAFIYNFIQFTQWPKGSGDSGPLNVCANPGGPLFSSLLTVAGKPAAGRPLLLLPLADARAERCHVLVATEVDRPQIAAILAVVGEAPVLTITDDAESIRFGLMIGMAIESGKMTFIIDNTRAGRVGLNISSRLLRLARSVQ